LTDSIVLQYRTIALYHSMHIMIAPKTSQEFEETFSIREKGETFARVLASKGFRIPCFTQKEEVEEQGAATAAAGMGMNVNPYPRGDARRSAWNSGFSKTLV